MDPAYAAAQRREWCLFDALIPHAFGHTVYQTVAHGDGRFRRYVAWSNAGSASGRDEVYFSRQANEHGLDLDQIVGNDLTGSDVELELSQKLSDRWAGPIFPLAASA